MNKSKKDKNITNFDDMPDVTGFWCKDIELASALLSAGIEEFELEKAGGEIYFVFSPSGFLAEMIDTYYRNELKISAKTLFENTEKLRARSLKLNEDVF